MEKYLLLIIALLAVIALVMVLKSVVMFIWIVSSYFFIIPVSRITGIFSFGADSISIIIASAILGIALSFTIGAGGSVKSSGKGLVFFLLSFMLYVFIK